MRGRALLSLIAGLCLSCGAAGAEAPRTATPHYQRTCLVLSVGAQRGLAHLGAIEAVRVSRTRIDCVVGNSMGALVGALYASAPAEDTTVRYRRFIGSYEVQTRSEAAHRGVAGMLLGGLIVVLSGGTALPVIAAGAAAAGAAAAVSVSPVDHQRFIGVLDGFVGRVTIEALPLPYATFTQRPDPAAGVRLVPIRAGDLAQAVGASVANPFVFHDIDVRQSNAIDPGLDRAAATPVEDACALFPDARLIAVNVTGQPIFTSTRMHCPVIEIPIDVGSVPPEAMMPGNAAFDRVVRAGYEAALPRLRAACGS